MEVKPPSGGFLLRGEHEDGSVHNQRSLGHW